MKKRQFLITADGSHTLYIPELDETYHSIHGAIQESMFVYIEQGLNYFAEKEISEKIRIFEVGFGTGLNALLSAIYAEKHHVFLQYECLETSPLGDKEIKKLNYPAIIGGLFSKELFQNIHDSPWSEWVEICTYFQFQKIKARIQDYGVSEIFDICFFDAFAPSKQPEMWSLEVLEKVFSLLNYNGVLVTYCAKGQLKRDLKSIGFKVETLPGPPGKMQMVRAIKLRPKQVGGF